MIIVIDGYNLLRQIYPKEHGCLEKQRRGLVKLLAYYKNKKQKELKDIVLVFDAGPLSHATREIHGGVTVIFSGQRSNADEWITEYVKRHAFEEKLLITLDRELIENCEKYNTLSMDVFEFYSLVKRVILESGQNTQETNSTDLQKYEYESDLDDKIKNSNINNQALDLLMEQASMSIPQKDVPREPQNTHSAKLSKKERKIYSVLKKIK